MVRSKAEKGGSVAAVIVYVLLIGMFATYYLPMQSVTLPAGIKMAWSVKDIFKALPKARSSAAQQESASEEKSKLDLQIDFMDLVREISPKNQGKAALSKETILGTLVPIALVLTYVFALLALIVGLLRKKTALVVTTALSAICSAYVLFATYYFSSLAQKAYTSTLSRLNDIPFSGMAKQLMGQITITPEIGLFALVGLSFIAFGISFSKKS